MWIITRARLYDYCDRHADARGRINRWYALVDSATWRRFADLQHTFGPRNVDEVRVASGRLVVVFDIGGNEYRLVAAVHYNTGKVFVREFMSHAEYSKGKWKDRH